MFDINAIRALFPITQQRFPVYGRTELVPVIYFDHGASTHPPQPVLDEYMEFLAYSYSNVHRGQHYLSMIATDMFEGVYAQIFDFIGASEAGNSVVLTQNTTGALDLAAHIMAHVDGATLVTCMEHHSNDLPHRRRGEIVRAEVCEDGSLDYDHLERQLKSHKIKLVAVTGASNVTGFLTDLDRVAALAHANGAKILVDAAQLLAHQTIDVHDNSHPSHIDFLAAAGHKAYSPFGGAFLFGPEDVMNEAPPYVPGGGTVEFVTDDTVQFDKTPDRHQGGTPNIAGGIALGAALRFIREIGMSEIRQHERELTEFAMKSFAALEGVTVLGNPDPSKRLGVVAFTIEGVRHDLVSVILNHEAAIATRNGRFCAHPYMRRLLHLDPEVELKRIRDRSDGEEIAGAVRATFGVYNTHEEVEELVRMIRVIRDRNWKAKYEAVGPASACTGNVFSPVG